MKNVKHYIKGFTAGFFKFISYGGLQLPIFVEVPPALFCYPDYSYINLFLIINIK